MKFLLISQYFWPETFIINELVEVLVQQGNSVKVLTGKPNYPGGVISSGYVQKGCMEESYNGNIPVFRAPLRPRYQGGARNLLLNYLSFVINGLYHFPSAIKNEDYDVILVFSPSPITAVIPAIALKWRLKSHLAVWVQDLWPQSLKATGFIQNRFLLKITGLLVRGIYFFSDTLLVQSHAFKRAVNEYAKADKIEYYPNSYRDNKVSENAADSLPKELLDTLNQYHCFVFAGNLGTAQSIQTLMAAAKKIAHLPDARLIFVGSGSMSDWILEEKNKNHLDNVIIAGRYPSTAMPAIFSRAMALVVSLTKDAIFSYTVPCKIQAYLAAGRPILAALDGEGAKVILDAQAGLASAAEDADQLAANIEKIYFMSTVERDQLGKSGRAYFLQHFEMEKQATRLVDILNKRIKVIES